MTLARAFAVTTELQNASKRRAQCEDDLRTLRAELASANH